MATKHRIPTIFNLSMVDVLCCALGCVILLWLVNLRDAKDRGEAAGQTSAMLAQTQEELEQTAQRLQTTTKEREQAGRALASANIRLAGLDKELKDLQGQYATAQDRLAKKTKEQSDLVKELTAAKQKVEALDILVREKEAMARATARTTKELEERLRDADARVTQLTGQAGQLPKLRDEVKSLQNKLSASETTAAALQRDVDKSAKDLAGADKSLQALEATNRRLDRALIALRNQLADAERSMGTLREEKRSLADQASRARAAAENRFAGIALTGRRVVFLVDMSGSMELVDENTNSPEKWVEVRQTLARIMRSLPDLEKFQVVLFATRTSYLLGNDDRWLDFDPVTSTGKVAEALAKVKPKGNTDMYAAFEAAFRFRSQGLDTIYLLSDGLPNVGAGLAPEIAQRLKETERAEILSKYVRRTLLTLWNRKGPGQSRVRINSIGFFYESPDVGAFLWALAREHEGSFVGMSKP
jgi:hypothetical protein